MHRKVEIEAAAENILSDEAGFARLRKRFHKYLVAALELAAYINERVVRLDCVGAQQNAFDNLMRRLFEQHAVFERPGFGLVAIADQIARPDIRRQERPLLSGRKAGAAAPAQS